MVQGVKDGAYKPKCVEEWTGRVLWALQHMPCFLIFHFCRFLNMLSGDGWGSFLVVANKHGDQKPRFHLDVVALPLFSSGLLLERFVL